MSIYVRQSYIDVRLNMVIDVSTASSKKIAYKKPDGTRGILTVASLQGNSILVASIDNNFFDQPGVWEFQGVATIGGREAKSKIVQQKVEPSI
jgi:hypothetical protein